MRGHVIDIDSDAKAETRKMEFEAEDRDNAADEEARRTSNRNFTQVYPKGWKRLQLLIRTNPSAARVYAFLAENIDGTCGAVVVSQEVIAQELGVHKRTVIRLCKQLEEMGALVRLKVGNGVNAYALDPEEIWKSWDDQKDLASFRTRTLVRKSDRANGQVRRKLRIMMGEPEIPGLA